MAYDWSRFQLRIPILAPITEIYPRWATSAGLTSWFLRQADFHTNEGEARPGEDLLRPGDRYLWRWFGYPDEVQETGSILAANHQDSISFSFGKAGNVTVRLYRHKEVTICELVQTDIPTDEYGQVQYHLGCTRGWLFYLANLKSLLEGGIDLRNRDAEIQDVVNA